MKAETLPIPPQNWNQYLRGPLTHTLSRVQRMPKRFENMTSEVELTCVDGGGARHALVASSLSQEALPFSEDHMESNR